MMLSTQSTIQLPFNIPTLIIGSIIYSLACEDSLKSITIELSKFASYLPRLILVYNRSSDSTYW